MAQSPKVKIAAPRDMPKPMTINELKSILIGQSLKSGCGWYCRDTVEIAQTAFLGHARIVTTMLLNIPMAATGKRSITHGQYKYELSLLLL